MSDEPPSTPKRGSRLDRYNLAQRVAIALGCVMAILLISSALVPPIAPGGGWYGYAPNTVLAFGSRPSLFGRLGGYRPWATTLWWLATDAIATAVAVRILRVPDRGDG